VTIMRSEAEALCSSTGTTPMLARAAGLVALQRTGGKPHSSR